MTDLDVLDSRSGKDGFPSSLPYATACLVLGIISIATCWIYGVPGVVCGIIAIVLHMKDRRIYLSDKEKYEHSFKTSKAGLICGIIGLSISAFMLIYFIFVFFVMASVLGAARF
ncbi:hypothetical protein D3C87_309920 [compost metagenome]